MCGKGLKIERCRPSLVFFFIYLLFDCGRYSPPLLSVHSCGVNSLLVPFFCAVGRPIHAGIALHSPLSLVSRPAFVRLQSPGICSVCCLTRNARPQIACMSAHVRRTHSTRWPYSSAFFFVLCLGVGQCGGRARREERNGERDACACEWGGRLPKCMDLLFYTNTIYSTYVYEWAIERAREIASRILENRFFIVRWYGLLICDMSKCARGLFCIAQYACDMRVRHEGNGI